MDCPIPSPRDVRQYLEGYCLDTTGVFDISGSFSSGSTEISNLSDVEKLRPGMLISGSGILTDSKILSVDYEARSIVLSKPTSASGTDEILTVTKYAFLTDSWLISRRDRFIIPWIEKRTSLNIRGDRIKTEYVSGNGLSTLILSHHPIIELLGLSYVGDSSEEISLVTEAVEIDSEQGILIAKTSPRDASSVTYFPRGVKNIKVTYKHGYSNICEEAPDVPEAILVWMAAYALQMIGARTGGGQITTQGFNQSFGDRGKYTEAIKAAETEVMAILRGYFNYVGAP